ncbi:hypothetical protein GCM10025331_26920 [Actinoplanes utahensis]|nr:hypothetical protein Aut01nite_38700 [Actinoplanes utahensis]
MAERDLETPEVDAAEQAIVAVPGWQDDAGDEPRAGGTGEWDGQEDNRTVDFDDDYR